MAKYRLSEQNLFIVLSHISIYGLTVIEVLSDTVDGQIVYTLELSGPIPEYEIDHFNSADQFLEVL